MKIMIVSDTHGKHENLNAALRKEGPIDRLIHLGDAEGYEDYIEGQAQCPVDIVAGNNDFFSQLPQEKEIFIGKYRALITHGHYYRVAMGTEYIKDEAVARGVDIVMFGHTHRPLLDCGSEVVVLNPGSISYPRQEGRRPTYMTMFLNDDGDAVFEQHWI